MMSCWLSMSSGCLSKLLLTLIVHVKAWKLGLTKLYTEKEGVMQLILAGNIMMMRC